MYNPPNSDMQRGYSHPRDEETHQTRKPRAQQACVLCRTRKRKCDGSKPCKKCSEEGKGNECQYDEVPPLKYVAIFD